ncbi:MAG: rod shape-determining protein MreD [Kiritimatiellaeota bacterium]|nr:rod shape-determining protein MreD [Kiritimatiellota bacterium]
MKQLVMLIALVTAAAAQALLPAWAWLGGAQAPVLLALVLFYGFSSSRARMLICAFAAGLLQDALGQVPLGFSCLCFALAGLWAQRHRDDVDEQAIISQIIVGGIAAAMVTLLLYFLLRHAGAISLPLAGALRKVLGTVLLAAALTPVVFRVAIGLERSLGERPALDHGGHP